jgi:hypothetical protein
MTSMNTTARAFALLAEGDFSSGLTALNQDPLWQDLSDDLAGPFRLRFQRFKGWGEGLLIASLLKRRFAECQQSVQVHCGAQLGSILRSDPTFDTRVSEDDRGGRSPWAVLKQALVGELLSQPFVPLATEASRGEGSGSRTRIGFAWSSRNGKGVEISEEKSMPWQRFVRLFDGVDSEFVSFQREASEEENGLSARSSMRGSCLTRYSSVLTRLPS